MESFEWKPILFPKFISLGKMEETEPETPDKPAKPQKVSFLLFGISTGTSLTITIVCLILTIFAQTKGNTDLNFFLWTTTGCAICLCIIDILLGIIGVIAVYQKSYTILLACSSLGAICGLIVYFLIGIGYFFCAIMTVFVMEDHPKSVKICLLVNLGLGAARFFIFVFSIVVGLLTGTTEVSRKLKMILGDDEELYDSE